MKIYKFETIILKHHGMDAAYIEFPYNTEKEFGSKGQVKVKVTFDGVEYRGSLVKMGMDCHWIGITKEIRKQIGKHHGDKINITIQKDEEPRTIETPPDLMKLLKKDNAVLNYFESLSYTHRREYINWINEAKKVETRNRRIGKAMELLKSGRKEPR